MLRDVLGFVGLSHLADFVSSEVVPADHSARNESTTAEHGVSRTEAPRFSALPPHLQAEIASHRGQSIRIVIRGARRAGKTTLLHRLQGMQPPTNYVPSQSIESGVFMWKPIKRRFHNGGAAAAVSSESAEAVSAPVTRVDVWAVVDKGSSGSLGRSTTERNVQTTAVAASMALPTDATTVDIYRDCQGVIFVLDCTTQHTFDYVARELPSVPAHIPVAILSNFADVAHCDPERREVSKEDEARLLRSVPPARTPLVAQLMGGLCVGSSVPDGCSEFVVRPTLISTSLKEGYGLRPLHAFVGACALFDLARQAERVVSSSYLRLQCSLQQLDEINSGQDWDEFLEWRAQWEQRKRHPHLQQSQHTPTTLDPSRDAAKSDALPASSSARRRGGNAAVVASHDDHSSKTPNFHPAATESQFESLKTGSIDEEDASFFSDLGEYEEDPVWVRSHGVSGVLQHTPSRSVELSADAPTAGTVASTRSGSFGSRPRDVGSAGRTFVSEAAAEEPTARRRGLSAISPQQVAQLASEMELHLRECGRATESTAGYAGSPT